MEESKALVRLLETADLVAMVEDLMSPGACERLSASSWSGMRVTLRNVKEMIRTSHAALSESVIQRARAGMQNGASQNGGAHSAAPKVEENGNGDHTRNSVLFKNAKENGATISEAQRVQMTRRDLRTSLERIVEK